METKQQAQHMLDQLKQLDSLVHRAYYEMGRILTAFRDHRLWELLEYNSMQHLVEEELSCSYSTACQYMKVYSHLKRLKYNKGESIDLIENVGLRALSRLLPSTQHKVSKRSLRKKKETLDHCVAFWVSPAEEAMLEEVLVQYGLRVENGRWMNSSEALLALLADRQSKAA